MKAPPKITEAPLAVALSGDTCSKPAMVDVIIAAEAPRPVFYKIERGNGTTTIGDWIEGKIGMQKGLTRPESAFLRAEHDLGGLDLASASSACGSTPGQDTVEDGQCRVPAAQSHLGVAGISD